MPERDGAAPVTVEEQPTSDASRRPTWLVDALVALAIFAVAALPRLASLDVFLTPDELRWACRSTNFYHALAGGELAETYQKEHPGVITMWLGGLAQPIDAGSDWARACHDLEPSKLVSQTTPETLAVIRDRLFTGRVRIALFVSLGIAGIYLLAARLFDRRAALLAAILMLLDPLYLAQARVLHLDAVTTTLMMLSLLGLLVYLLRAPSLGYLALSGVLGGLAGLNKSPGLFMGVVTVLFVAAIGWRERRAVRDIARDIALWGVIAVVTYVALWPAMWVDPVGALGGVLGGALGYAGEPHEGSNYFWGAIRPDPGPFFYPVSWLFRTTPWVLLGCVLTLVRLVRRRGEPAERAALLALVAFAVLFGLFMTTGAKKFDRYLLPVYPSLILFASVGLAGAVRWLARAASERWAPRRADAAVWGGALLIIAVTQAALVLPHRPYYLSYYNPLAGGSNAALWALLVGWGEGIDQPARYLNAKPGADTLQVATRYRSAFGPLFDGVTLEMDDYDPASLDYYLLYQNQIQRDLDPALIARLVDGGTEPEMLASFAGIDYAWLYPNDNYVAPLAMIEARARAGDAIVARADSLLAKHYDGALPLVLIEADAEAETLRAQLEEAFRAHDRLWYVRYDDIYPRPGLAAVDYELATRVFTLAEETFPEVAVRLLRSDGAPRFGGVLALTPTAVDFGAGELSMTSHGGTTAPIQWGRDLGVTLSWAAPEGTDRNLTAFLHLMGPDGRRWAQVDKPVTDADLVPTALWEAGTWAVDHYHLGVPAGTPPGDYTLLVGVYDSDTGERLPVRQDGTPLPDEALALPVTVGRSPFTPDAEALDLTHVVEDTGTRGIALLGYGLAGPVEGGRTAPLTLAWTAKQAAAGDHKVTLAVRDATGALVGQRTFETLLPDFPNRAWEAGDIARGWYEVPLDGRTLAGDGSLSVTLMGPDGRPIGARRTEVPLEITGPERWFTLPEGAAAVNADLGDQLTLAGHGPLAEQVKAGEPLTVTVFWGARAPVDVSYTGFVHLLDPAGALVAQVDSIPVGGAHPTTWWLEGEVVPDTVVLGIPPDAAAGRYTVVAGMYDGATLERLPALVEGARQASDQVWLGEVEVGR